MKLELAKAGSHNDIVLTCEDLKEMLENFTGDVPVTIGHELDDSMPAFGWIKSVELSEDGTILIGEIELSEELETAIDEGKYKNWSIGAGRDSGGKMYLHHLAFLGAVPPMIKDLRIVEFGDFSEVITFTSANEAQITLSDTEQAELESLRLEKKQAVLTKLSDATAGKLPFGKREELLSFADKRLSEGGDELIDLLSGIFDAIKKPVKTGISQSITAKQAEMRSVFARI